MSSTKNPFEGRAVSLSGPASDIAPVTPDDTALLPLATAGLYVETGGALVIETVTGETRTITVADFTLLPLRAAKVLAGGTTATGIHAMVLV